MKPVVLVSAQQEFIPVVKALAAEEWGIICLDRTFHGTLKNLEIPARHLQEFGDGQMADRAYTEAHRLLASLNGRYPTDGLASGPAGFIDQKAPAFVTSRIVDLCGLVLALDRAKPALVLLHNDVEPVNRLAALWARARELPCLHVPHAIYQDINRGGVGTDVHDLITASYLAAAGPAQRAWYEARGFPPDRVRETGLPQHDRWHKPNVDRRRARRLLKVFEPETRTPSEAMRVITYCATWTQNTNIHGFNDQWLGSYLAWIEAVKRLHKKSPRLFPIVKCHPRGGQENWQWHADQARANGLRCAVTPGHLEIVLHASDVVVAFGGSNVLVEASFVPTVRGLLTTHGYEEDEAVVKVGMDPDSMVEEISTCLDQDPPDLGAFRHRWAGPADGRATERVTAWIKELAV